MRKNQNGTQSASQFHFFPRCFTAAWKLIVTHWAWCDFKRKKDIFSFVSAAVWNMCFQDDLYMFYRDLYHVSFDRNKRVRRH